MASKAPWIICPLCRGNGHNSSHLGAITMDEWDHNWSPEEQEQYLAGGYDRTCGECAGSGKVLRDRPPVERDYAWESEARLREMGG